MPAEKEEDFDRARNLVDGAEGRGEIEKPRRDETAADAGRRCLLFLPNKSSHAFRVSDRSLSGRILRNPIPSKN